MIDGMKLVERLRDVIFENTISEEALINMLDKDHSKNIDELEFRFFLDNVALLLKNHESQYIADVLASLVRGAPKMWLYVNAWLRNDRDQVMASDLVEKLLDESVLTLDSHILSCRRKAGGPEATTVQLQASPNEFIAVTPGRFGLVASKSDRPTDRVQVHAYEGVASRQHALQCEAVDLGYSKDVIFATSMSSYLRDFTEYLADSFHQDSGVAHVDGDQPASATGGRLLHDTISRIMLRFKLDKRSDDTTTAANNPLVTNVLTATARGLERTKTVNLRQNSFGIIEVVLRRLCQWLEEQDLTILRRRQQLLLCQGVVQATMDLLGAVSLLFPGQRMDVLSRDAGLARFKSMVSSTWTFMQLAEQGYSPSGQYIVNQSLELLLDHVVYGVNALPCLVEAFTNNINLNQSIDADTPTAQKMRESLVQFTFKTLDKLGRIKLLIQLLTNACVDTICDGVGEVRHGRMCLLVMQSIEKNRGIFLDTRINDDGRLEVNAVDPSDDAANWRTVDELEQEGEFDLPSFLTKAAAGKNPGPPRPSLQLFQAFLELLWAICTDETRDAIKTLVPWEEAYAAILDPRIDLLTRGRYINLVAELYVGAHGIATDEHMWSWPRTAQHKEVEAEVESPRVWRSRTHSFISVSQGSGGQPSSGTNMIRQLRRVATTILTGSEFEKLVSTSVAPEGFAPAGFYFFFEVAARLGRLVLPILSGFVRAEMLKSLGLLVQFLGEHQRNPADEAEADIGLFESVCRAWNATLVAAAEREVIPRIIEDFERSVADTPQTASAVFQNLDIYAEKYANVDDFAVVMSNKFPARIRAEALKIMGDVNNNRKTLLTTLEEIVWVGPDGHQVMNEVETLMQNFVDDMAHLRASDELMSSFAANEDTSGCVQRLTRTIQAANAYIDPDAEQWSTNQDIMRKLDFHQHVIAATRFKAREYTSKERSSAVAAQQEHEDKLVDSCFVFLWRFCDGKRANQTAIAEATSIQFLFDNFFAGCARVSEFLLALVQDNREIAIHMSQDNLATICRTISWHGGEIDLQRSRIHCTLLQRLVISERRPVVALQNYVYQLVAELDLWDKRFFRHCVDVGGKGPHYISIKKEELTPAHCNSATSRLNYHIRVIHLLADCATENEENCQHLRHFLPSGLFIGQLKDSVGDSISGHDRKGVLIRDDLPPQLYSAYLHLFQKIYVDPVGMGGDKRMVDSIFFRPSRLDQLYQGSKYSALAGGIRRFLDAFVASEPATLFPTSEFSCGGLINMLTAIFATNLVEFADEILIEDHGHSHEINTSQSISKMLRGCKAKVVSKIEELVAHADTHLKRELLSSFVAAIRLSTAFGAEHTKYNLYTMVDSMVAEMTCGGFSSHVNIDDSDKLVRVARLAWGDAHVHHAVAQPKFPEDYNPDVPDSTYWWSQERRNAPDRFQMARYVANIANTAKTVDEEDGHHAHGAGFDSVDTLDHQHKCEPNARSHWGHTYRNTNHALLVSSLFSGDLHSNVAFCSWQGHVASSYRHGAHIFERRRCRIDHHGPERSVAS